MCQGRNLKDTVWQGIVRYSWQHFHYWQPGYEKCTQNEIWVKITTAYKYPGLLCSFLRAVGTEQENIISKHAMHWNQLIFTSYAVLTIRDNVWGFEYFACPVPVHLLFLLLLSHELETPVCGAFASFCRISSSPRGCRAAKGTQVQWTLTNTFYHLARTLNSSICPTREQVQSPDQMEQSCPCSQAQWTDTQNESTRREHVWLITGASPIVPKAQW